jgi:hypothetical protein
VTSQRDVELLIHPLIHTETRIEGIQVLFQIEQAAEQRGNPVSQLPASSCMNTGALHLVVERKNSHTAYRGDLVLLAGAHREEKLLGTKGYDDLNMGTELVYFDETMKIQTNC